MVVKVKMMGVLLVLVAVVWGDGGVVLLMIF